MVLCAHEFAHAFTAYKCGDPTAKFSGRMTLNPMKHFDPIGLILFAVAGFGWAKPVPINPNNFRNYRRGSLLTASAGVITNYIMAFLFYPLFILVLAYVCPIVAGTYAEIFLISFFQLLFVFSLSFCVFNLLPLYPLDGFRIVDALDRKHGKIYWFLRQYGNYILLGLIAINILSSRIPFLGYINILGYVMQFAIKVLGRPIFLLWDWVFGLIL